mmetsp:Transcript_15453/g.34259  ORF Transcript_15453/g.34259 Transcript_15453/m.34259 type:complete len:226 (-) Transcript_15453:130-807(-)
MVIKTAFKIMTVALVNSNVLPPTILLRRPVRGGSVKDTHQSMNAIMATKPFCTEPVAMFKYCILSSAPSAHSKLRAVLNLSTPFGKYACLEDRPLGEAECFACTKPFSGATAAVLPFSRSNGFASSARSVCTPTSGGAFCGMLGTSQTEATVTSLTVCGSTSASATGTPTGVPSSSARVSAPPSTSFSAFSAFSACSACSAFSAPCCAGSWTSSGPARAGTTFPR